MKNQNIRLLLIIALIINCLESFSQDTKGKSVFITGIIFDSKTQDPLPNTNYRINNKDVFKSNEYGRFSFMGNPGDSIVFSFVGYHVNRLVVPDTLKSSEYVMGVFMHEEPVKLSEIIILARVPSTSIIINSVPTDEEARIMAQNNIIKAVEKSLTQYAQDFDADMNAKQSLRNNQSRIENKGMLVSPENSAGISTQNRRLNNIIYGSPIFTKGKFNRDQINSSESASILGHFRIFKKKYNPAAIAKEQDNSAK